MLPFKDMAQWDAGRYKTVSFGCVINARQSAKLEAI
jgi:hypothetical protein